jgi:PAS domain S-box-containing protein
MPPERSPEDIAAALRRLQRSPEDASDPLALKHEISVYQEELQVQNEALMRAQAALEESRDRFVDLYDFAPTGYMTLDGNGVVLQCNLTAAALLGKARPAVEGLPLLGFVVDEERERYFQFLRRCHAAPPGTGVEVELTLRTAGGAGSVQLLCRRRTLSIGTHELFVSLVDLTERRALEREREQAARDRAALVIRLLAAQDDERQRIARNLHDDIGQQNTVIRLKLERLAERIGDDALRHTLAELRELFDRLDRGLHFVAAELRPSALDLGLVTALDQYVREWSETFGVQASFTCQVPDIRFAPDVETHLYRIAQETLSNISKHAAARSVSMILNQRRDGAVLIIEDDGRGFDVAATRAGNSPLGLVGMRERAQIIGGRLEIESAPGQGTSVFVYVPLPPLAAPHGRAES